MFVLKYLRLTEFFLCFSFLFCRELSVYSDPSKIVLEILVAVGFWITFLVMILPVLCNVEYLLNTII